MATKTKTRAYADTQVSAAKSMGEVMDLLEKRKATGMQWTAEGPVSTLRFRWKTSDGVDLCARFRVEIKPPTPPRGVRLTSEQIGKHFEQEKRRMFRVLVYFIKNLFEAVDGGLLTLEQALLPYLEDASGATVGELMAPRLGRLQAGPLSSVLALGPGKP